MQHTTARDPCYCIVANRRRKFQLATVLYCVSLDCRSCVERCAVVGGIALVEYVACNLAAPNYVTALVRQLEEGRFLTLSPTVQ